LREATLRVERLATERLRIMRRLGATLRVDLRETERAIFFFCIGNFPLLDLQNFFKSYIYDSFIVSRGQNTGKTLFGGDT
jgi:hypothetical protein